MVIMRIDTPLTLLVTITEQISQLLAGQSGEFNPEIREDLVQIYDSSQLLHLRLERALNSQAVSDNRLMHELRGPLNIIVGYSEIMLDGLDGTLNNMQRLVLENVLENGLALSARLLELYG
jgi:signal transduction histidine kinase